VTPRSLVVAAAFAPDRTDTWPSGCARRMDAMRPPILLAGCAVS